MNRQKRSLLMSSLAMMALGNNIDTEYPNTSSARPKPQQRPPKGSKEYWFNDQGEYSSEQMRKTEVVFSCYAINDKNAIRKYNKWKNNQ